MESYPKNGYVLEKEAWRMYANGLLEKELKTLLTFMKCKILLIIRWVEKKIKDSILDVVGNTPLVWINNITQAEGIKCEVLVKCEYLNPGGSVKDRIGRWMVLDAEK